MLIAYATYDYANGKRTKTLRMIISYATHTYALTAYATYDYVTTTYANLIRYAHARTYRIRYV